MVIGVAFEFGEEREAEVMSYLRAREGASLVPEVRDILLPNIEQPIRAVVFIPKLQGAAYIGALPIAERAAMAKVARGTHGACEDYARSAQRQLRALGIHDSGIEDFVSALDATR
jgi:cation transport regulator ChaC